MAAAGGLIRLPKRLPLAIALELAMTGDPIDADRALQLGLVNRVVPAPRCSTTRSRSPTGSRPTPRSRCASPASSCGRRSSSTKPTAGSARTSWRCEAFASGDAIEGATAFAEKRQPVWKST